VLKAVTFDLGDTLIDYGPMDYSAMLRHGLRSAIGYLATLRGVVIPGEKVFGRRMARAARHTWYRSKLLAKDHDVERVLLRMAGELGIHLPNRETEKELIRRLFDSLEELTRPMPGVAETLAALRDRGLALAVVSNTLLPGWLLDESLADVGLLEFFPVRFYSCAENMKKPQRRLFRHVLSVLGAEPQEVLHVGDRYLTDIWGARRAGLRSCLIRGHRSIPLPPVRPDFRIHKMSELVAIVDRLI
jgi:putative hydrolase of the HAD superfamily